VRAAASVLAFEVSALPALRADDDPWLGVLVLDVLLALTARTRAAAARLDAPDVLVARMSWRRFVLYATAPLDERALTRSLVDEPLLPAWRAAGGADAVRVGFARAEGAHDAPHRVLARAEHALR
jgi:hypothetical protein